MASLIEIIKQGATIEVDRGQLEIEKKVAKEKAKKFLGGFTGIHPSSQKEQQENIKKKNDEYLKEHNKMFTGYDGTRRQGPEVRSNSSSFVETHMKQNGRELGRKTKEENVPRSRMRVGGESFSGQRGGTAVYSDKRGVSDRPPATRPSKSVVSSPDASRVKERDYSGMNDTLKAGGLRRP